MIQKLMFKNLKNLELEKRRKKILKNFSNN